MARFPFATVLTPFNHVLLQDAAFRFDHEQLVDEVRRQDAGLLTITAVARRDGPEALSPDSAQPYTTWYEPHDDRERIRAAVSWALAHVEVTAIATAGDVRLLGIILDAERERMPFDDAVAALQSDPDASSPFVHMPC